MSQATGPPETTLSPSDDDKTTTPLISSVPRVIRHISPPQPNLYLPIYVMTGVFGSIFIIAPLLVRKGPNQGLIRCCIWITTFCFWVLWFTVYVAQMNPLVGPRLKNTTVAWIAHSWGRTAEPSEEPASYEEESGEWVNVGIGVGGRESGDGIWSGGGRNIGGGGESFGGIVSSGGRESGIRGKSDGEGRDTLGGGNGYTLGGGDGTPLGGGGVDGNGLVVGKGFIAKPAVTESGESN